MTSEITDPVTKELEKALLERIQDSIVYAQRRKTRFRLSSSAIRMATLSLSAASTVILGLQDLNFWASVGFSMVALTTLAGAIEPFFNWRSRWLVMEDMQADLHRLEADLRYLIARRGASEIALDDLDDFHARLQEIWAHASDAWSKSRRVEAIESAKNE